MIKYILYFWTSKPNIKLTYNKTYNENIHDQ